MLIVGECVQNTKRMSFIPTPLYPDMPCPLKLDLSHIEVAIVEDRIKISIMLNSDCSFGRAVGIIGRCRTDMLDILH